MLVMLEKIDLHLLILCGILCHGITATLLDEDARESSDFLIRKRRVINHLPDGSNIIRIEVVNYIVSIKEFNRVHCAGVILSHYSVITAASCVRIDLQHYQILSGSAYEQYSDIHHVTSKAEHFGSPPHQEYDGIALITVDPPFVFNSKTGFINLYVGALPPGTHGTVTGWGCTYPVRPGPPGIRHKLRSISVPILRLRDCRSVYRNSYSITEKHICTHDKDQYCARADAGAPLVVNNSLVGIHVWKGEIRGQINPDVYIDLQTPDYSEWIRHHTLLM